MLVDLNRTRLRPLVDVGPRGRDRPRSRAFRGWVAASIASLARIASSVRTAIRRSLRPNGARRNPGAADGWSVVLAVFWLTSMVEGIGMSQIFAYMPSLLRDLGARESDRLALVGVFSSLLFVVGLPLVPLWGVWADRYSRKAVIVRSGVVQSVVLAGVALSRDPWQLGLSVLLIGFELGNTGVMLAAIRDVAPAGRIGTIVGTFGAAGPIGFAAGPFIGGILVDGLRWPISGVFWLSAVLSGLSARCRAFCNRGSSAASTFRQHTLAGIWSCASGKSEGGLLSRTGHIARSTIEPEIALLEHRQALADLTNIDLAHCSFL
jgi:MFS family permease